jgi:hypothetical protein
VGSRVRIWTLCSALILALAVTAALAVPPFTPDSHKTAEQKEWLIRHPAAMLKTTLPPAEQAPVEKMDGPSRSLVPEVVLYDQLTPASATANATSQNFEAIYDTYDTQAADDFVVTGSGWNVTTVVAPGAYSVTHGVPSSIHVAFYNDLAGLPSGAPVCDRPTATFVEGPTGTYTITLAPACTLSPGTKWVSVQVNLNFGGGGGQWFWTTRTVTSNSGAAWQNPGGGFGTPCASWGREATCLSNVALLDHTFQLQGTIASCTVDADCADANLCNGAETCQVGACVAGTPVNCDDSLFCTIDACTPATGACTHAPNTCPDGNGCTTDTCDEANDVCNHVNNSVHLCNATSISIPNTPAVPFPGVPYPSNIVAAGLGTTASLCSVELKAVSHTFPDDIDIMLVGPAGGTQNRSIWSDAGGSGDIAAINITLSDDAATALSDAGPLASGTFKPANYTSTPADAWPAPAPAPTGLAPLNTAFSGINPNGTWSLYVVDDSAGDTGSIAQGWCINLVVAGCSADPDCSDGNPCNGAETCQANNCVPGTPTDCNDSDVCTTDSCIPASGLCAHAPVVCNDSNVCTDDTCVSPAQGCTFTNNTAPCTDNDLCTTGDICGGGSCTPGGPTNCDDQSDCTTDTCSPAQGCLHQATAGGVCSDGDPCTDSDTCQVPCNGNFSENFDGVTAPALPAGWSTALVTGNAGDIAWRTAVSPDTPPNGANTDDPSHITDKVLDSLVLPSGATQVSFRNSFILEGSAPNFYDGGVLEIKIGGGAFQDVIAAGGSFVTGGYVGAISTGFSSPIAGRTAWSGNSGGFITTTVNLPASSVGQPTILRWRVASDVSVSGTGMTIDTVTATTCSSICAGSPVGSPGEVTGDTFAPDKQTFSWSPTVFASRYDVVRGRVELLPVGPGGDEFCFPDVVGTSLVDGLTPPAGLGNWYLVRGDNSCAAPGTYGTQSNLTPRITTTCP